jgi:hypothetical protein
LCCCGSSRKQEIFDENQNADFGGPRPFPALVGSGGRAFAQEFRPTHFSRSINEYLPLSQSAKGSLWELLGQWSRGAHPGWGTAAFLADMTMSGFGTTWSSADEKIEAFKQADEAVARARNKEKGAGCKTIPYADLQETCESQGASVHDRCDKAASCSEGEPNRELKGRLGNEQQNESRLKDERHGLEDERRELDKKTDPSADDQERKAVLETTIKKLDVEIEESGKRIAEFENDLSKRAKQAENAIPILEKCIDYRRAVQNCV